MTSLSRNARVAGLLYILASAVGVVRLMYIPNALFVHGNAAATADHAQDLMRRARHCEHARTAPAPFIGFPLGSLLILPSPHTWETFVTVAARAMASRFTSKERELP